MESGKKHILIVEDEFLLGNLLKQRLEHAGYQATVFQNGNDVLEFLKTNSPDLILLDIIMPGISGFEFMETMAGDPQYHKPPVIFVSNLGQESDIKRGESLGAVGYFVKAKVSMDEIIQNIEVFFLKKD